MKKLLSVSIAALVFAAVADATYTPITVGVTEIATSTTQKDYIIPVPYQTIGTNTAVTVHDLVKSANLPVGTKLFHYNGSSYQVWEVSSDKIWVAPDVSATDKIAGTSVSQGSDEVTIAVGNALWVVFGSNPDADQKIYVYGSPVATKTTTISETGKTYLLSNPTDSTIADLATKLASVKGKGDKILPIGEAFSGYYLYSGSSWVKVEGTTINTEASLPSLGAYAGFWYVNKTAGTGTTITW